jgi:uncharacterized membrane protein YkoI
MHMIKTCLMITLAALSLSACNDDDDKDDIPLTEVPVNIVTIVQNTLPGISLKSAEKEVKDGVVIYELEGSLINGNEYEIEISETGTVIKIELED